jgi:phosphatidate cytidylyltransferase
LILIIRCQGIKEGHPVNEATRDRWFGFQHAFDHSVVTAVVIFLGVVLVMSFVVIALLRRGGRIGAKQYDAVMTTWRSWLWLAPIMLASVLLGAAWVMAAVCLLSLLCYREYARATGLFREKAISLVVVLGILLVTFAAVDNYPRLFFASAALTVGLITVVTIPQDRPKGYIQRVALGALGFLLLGYSFGYLGFMANNADYRPMLVLIILGTELNDVFAFCTGKLVGGPKVLPNTSPGKTVAGCLGALVLTTVTVATLGHFVFLDTAMDRLVLLLILGAGLSILGQLGDLLMSSVKRDVGIKDISTLIPGHGGLLDRFDSLVLVPPAAFHFFSLLLGPLGSGQTERIFTGR